MENSMESQQLTGQVAIVTGGGLTMEQAIAFALEKSDE
jgi:hypothetical protein